MNEVSMRIAHEQSSSFETNVKVSAYSCIHLPSQIFRKHLVCLPCAERSIRCLEMNLTRVK